MTDQSIQPSTRDSAIATALRMATWALDDVAFDLPAGRLTPQRCAELIAALENLTELIRQRAQRSTTTSHNGALVVVPTVLNPEMEGRKAR